MLFDFPSILTGAALLASAAATPFANGHGHGHNHNHLHAHKPSTPSENHGADHPVGGEVTLPSGSPHRYGGLAAGQYHSPAWLPRGGSLHNGLPQYKTNGHSKLGTYDAPKLPPWLGGSPMPHGRPWGHRSAKGTNYYDDLPETGVTRHYDFTISVQDIAPDGVTRQGIVINGAYPGPTIEANWGDWIEVVVHNELPYEGTSLHWHGLLQRETPWFDGIPSVGQCPIAPGSTFTYRFRADLYGSSWYHSHYSAQYADGCVGPMIIYGPNDNTQYDEDLGPILLSDWYHRDYFDILEQVMAPAAENLLPPVSQNNLINGKMNYPCANATGLQCVPNAGISKFFVESGKTYRLRLINTGAEAIQKFSIDGATLSVIANDFVPLVPYETDVVTLGIGQRTDVVFTANGKSGDAVWMRSTVGKSAFVGGCSLTDGISPEAVAAIYYENANSTAVPQTTSSVSDTAINTCQNDPLSDTVPAFTMTPPATPAHTEQIDVTFQSNGTHNLFYMNNSTFRANYNSPTLLMAKLGTTTYPSESNVHDFGSAKSIRMVVYNHALTGAHPMHIHGHNYYVLAVGSGTWDGTVTNPSNPQRRDVQLLPNAVSATEPSYMVVQIDQNPGVWPFHCHIAWHVSAGLYVNVLEAPRKIEHEMRVPGIMAQTCRDWSAWTGENIPDEIDSGL